MDQAQDARGGLPLWAVLAMAADQLEEDPREALKRVSGALEFAPGQHQALQLLVSAYRALDDLPGARSALESMAKSTPDIAAVHYELGLLQSEMGENQAAIKSYSRVLELEPKHPQAWRMLGDEFARAGDTQAASDAYEKQFQSSLVDLKMLEQVTSLGHEQLEIAGNVLREYLNIYPTDLTALYLLGKTYVRVNQFEAAEDIFNRALDLDPAFVRARAEVVWVVHQLMKPDEECRHLDILLEDDPDNLDYRYLRAVALLSAGKLKESVDESQALLKEHPENAKLWVAYGYGLRVTGRQKECVAAFRRSVELDPGLGEAWWALANLKTFHFEAADIATMRKALDQKNVSDENRQALHFALGKALEDSRSYEKSFEHYRIGNALVRAKYPDHVDDIEEDVKRDKARFTRDFFVRRTAQGCQSADPIFILGLPRSGSTLVEQILASHSAVEAAGELPIVTTIARRINQGRLGEAEANQGAADDPFNGESLRDLGQEYLEACRKFRKTGRPFFTDKAPNNFRHLGLICSMLPNARIIDTRRHPLACCFSNFKQVFPSPLGPSYDIVDMGNYYRSYVELMAHFDRALPGRIHRVLYEELVDDFESQIRRLLDYCGLAFEESCLRFYETERSIMTVSSEQVKRPVYRESLEQWRHYDAWLGPLKDALGPVLDAYPAVPDMYLRGA